MARKMSRIGFQRDKLLDERLSLIKERHHKLILEPRKRAVTPLEPDALFDEDDDYEFLDPYDEIRVDVEETEAELF
jgi:hypothetical protein